MTLLLHNNNINDRRAMTTAYAIITVWGLVAVIGAVRTVKAAF